MRTTIDVPEPVFRRMKATAALLGVSLKDFVLSAVEHELAAKHTQKQHTVRLPLIRSKRPGTLHLTNAEIEDLLT